MFGKRGGQVNEDLRYFAVGLDFGNHLPIVGRRTEQFRVVRNVRGWIGLHRLGEFRRSDLRPLEHADAVQDEP
jgi:hypothetical protein